MRDVLRKIFEGKSRSQKGMTSVVVVMVLLLLLTLLSITFTKAVNRNQHDSSANQQATAANYAAQSGINDVISYLKTYPTSSVATAGVTNCNSLITGGAPLSSASQLSSSGDTSYTCALVNPNPSDLFYPNQQPYTSQVIKMTTTNPGETTTLLLSWQATSRQKNQFAPATDNQKLFDESVWATKNYAPLLRVAFYPIPDSGDISGTQSAGRIYYLYPQSTGSNSITYSSTASGLQAVNCSNKDLGSFAGTADYDCNVLIKALPSGSSANYYYLKITPYYDQADYKIKANDASNQVVKFKNVQTVIDVTAKSGGSTKRLQARADSSTLNGSTTYNIPAESFNDPEFAVQSADTVCKRIIARTPDKNIRIDPGSRADCGLALTPPPAPGVYFCVNVSGTCTDNNHQNISTGDGARPTLSWSVSGADDGCTISTNPVWSGPSGDGTGSLSVGPFSAPTATVTYTYSMTCSNPGGNVTQTVKINVSPNAQILSFSPSPSNVDNGGGSTLSWTNNAYTSTCDMSGASTATGLSANSSTGTGMLTGPATYSYTLTCHAPNGGNDATASTSVSVNAPPSAPADTSPYLYTFRQPDPATCSARYGFSHPNNCYDYSGLNLSSCTLLGVTFSSAPGGQSITMGDGPGTPGVTTLYCNGISIVLDGPPTGTPSTPLPTFTSMGVTYAGFWQYPGDYQKYNGALRPTWCFDTNPSLHPWIVCGVYTTQNTSFCTVYWGTFQEHQYDGVLNATGSNYGVELGWPTQQTTSNMLRYYCTGNGHWVQWTWYGAEGQGGSTQSG